MSVLYNILNKLTPSDADHYVEERKLLWTNESPTSSFAAQTISLDLSKCDTVEILFQRNLADYGGSVRTRVGDTSVLNFAGGTNFIRGFTVNTTGIVFGNGASFNTYANWIQTNVDEWCIPIVIYGIKKLGS